MPEDRFSRGEAPDDAPRPAGMWLVLLDVDGVVNPLDPRGPQAERTGFNDWEAVPRDLLPPLWRDVATAHRSLDQLAAIAALPNCEIVWATTWGDLAHPIWGGDTPVRRHVVPRPSKRAAIEVLLSGLSPDQHVAWIDDDLHPGGPLAEVLDGPATVTRIPTEAHRGLTADQLIELHQLLSEPTGVS